MKKEILIVLIICAIAAATLMFFGRNWQGAPPVVGEVGESQASTQNSSETEVVDPVKAAEALQPKAGWDSLPEKQQEDLIKAAEALKAK